MTIYRLSNLAVNINLKITFDSKIIIGRDRQESFASERFLPFNFMESLVKSPRKLPLQDAGKNEPFPSYGFNNRGQTSTLIEGSKHQPHTYLDTRVINSQQSVRKSRSETIRARLKTKEYLADLADKINDSDLSARLRRCHSSVGFLTCGQHILGIVPNYVCEFRLCPDCARRRSRKMQNKYLPIMTSFVKNHRVTPVHLVLTQKHKKETRKQSVERLRKAFLKLIRREFWQEHFKGGSWSVEFTKDEKGLHHTHLHLIAFRTKFFDIELLRSEWLSVTGDSHVLRVDRITGLAEGIKEVFKYVSKPMDIDRFTADDLRDFLKLKGMCFFGTFGEFRKFCTKFDGSDDDSLRLPNSFASGLTEGCACPHCEKPLFEMRKSVRGFVEYLRKIEVSPPS